MKELSLQELLVLKEIHLTGQTSDKRLSYEFADQELIADTEVGGFLLTDKGRSLLVRGSTALWDIAA